MIPEAIKPSFLAKLIKPKKIMLNIFNLGTNEYCQVNDSIAWICQYLSVSPRLEYTGGDRGWIGDNPFIFLDCGKIRALGWAPKLTIEEGIIKTITYLKTHSSLLT